jgi:integrase/recombinase XerD
MSGVANPDVVSIRLPRWGRVVAVDGVVPWLVVDPAGVPVEPIRQFLVDLVVRGNRAGSVRSYAFDLLRWWRRWLHAADVEWDRVTPAEGRDLVLWLKQAAKSRRHLRTVSAETAGAVNPITRKRHPATGTSRARSGLQRGGA